LAGPATQMNGPRAKLVGCGRSTLYYLPRLPPKDDALRREIERVMRTRAGRSYGYRRIARALGINEKRARRVMRKFGIKPYRRRGRKYRRVKPHDEAYPNLLQLVTGMSRFLLNIEKRSLRD
jgi:hypothetical protein